MAASWPPTSGAMRTSVARTTPTMGAVASRRHKKYPPAPTAMTNRPSAMIPANLRLTMGLPPLDQKRGDHRECEVDDGKSPQAAPVVSHLTKACAQLADANDAIDREIRRKYVTRSRHRRWDCFARPGKARHEKLRKARAEKDERRSLGVPETGARCRAHESGRERKQRGEREQLQRMAEGGKPVEARQHDEVERERGEIDRQMCDAAAEHARECPAGSLRQRDDGEHRSADQQHLLQDQHEGRGHDVARVAADRVEDRLQ